MLQSRDFRELLKLLEKHNVRYLVVGGYAVMLYSEPRWTKDLDLWIALDPPNSRAVFGALREFGAPLAKLTEQDFAAPGYFYQMGNPHPRGRDDGNSGGDFDAAWERRHTIALGDCRIHFIGGRFDRCETCLRREQDLKDVSHPAGARAAQSSRQQPGATSDGLKRRLTTEEAQRDASSSPILAMSRANSAPFPSIVQLSSDQRSGNHAKVGFRNTTGAAMHSVTLSPVSSK
jgi:hypothetical protein